MDFYRITKIRLINFHNFVDETLEIRDGGHLFMLGDNGSGKTTVLDAVHYVLCPGRTMEFNSAARVAGARHTGGRSIHGVVMRYNIEANGPLNPNGGITYAALEIAGRHGRPVTAAVGISTRSMEEDVERWAVLRECPMEELPLLWHEGDRTRPATKSELKAALDGNGYYGRIGAYIEELANRFFHDRETYDDVCKLLATGKAYREIASRTSDYHQLFRQLLQEPPRDVFEDVVTNLKSLEESRQDLENLRSREGFVTELAALRQHVLDARIDDVAGQWQERHLAAREFQHAYDLVAEELAAETRRLAELQEDEQRSAVLVEATASRLEKLRQQDAQGLALKEREARDRRDEAKRHFEAAKRSLVACQLRCHEATESVAGARDLLRKRAQAFARDVQTLGRAMPFSTTELLALLDDAPKHETPEDDLAVLPLVDIRGATDDTAQELDRQLQAAEARLDALDKRLAALAAEIEERTARGETVPLVKGFAGAERALQQHLLKAQPLYAGLEPASGVSPRDLAALEQLIGDDVLATWITDEANAAEVRRLLFREFPEQSLAVVSDDAEPMPIDWLPRYFDFRTSDPSAILALQHHLVAKHGPRVESFLELPILQFRLREQPLTTLPPRLIGAEMRRRELARELRDLAKKRDSAAKEQKSATKAQAELRERREQVSRFRALLNELGEVVPRQRDEVAAHVRELSVAEQAHESAQSECCFHEEELHARQNLHEDLLVSMRKAGLEGLEHRIRELEREYGRHKRLHEETIREAGRVEDRVGNSKTRMATQLAEVATQRAGRDAVQVRLLALVVPEIPLDEFVRSRCGDAAESREALRKQAIAASESAAVDAEKIRHRIVLNEGVAFGFIYDAARNSLVDRRGRDVADVLLGTRQELAEQEEVIGEKTRRLFRQIVMDSLVTKLQVSVRRLMSMSRRIGERLRERSFGNNRYAFTITPQEPYRRLFELVRDYRALDPEQTEQELREFIENHAAEIQSTEVGEIPPMLDYRNWFRYELKVLTTGADGIVMDRKVKSIGSGGEQAVPNYLLILTIAHFLFDKEGVRLPALIFDEAFYGIDAGRRDQLLGFASDLDLQLFVASPDQDGVKKDVPHSTSVLVVKDKGYNVHLYPFHWQAAPAQLDLLDSSRNAPETPAFDREL